MKLQRIPTVLGVVAALAGAAPAQNIAAYHDATGAVHQAQFNALANAGYRMRSLAIYGSDADPRYAAVWVQRPGPNFIGFHGLTAAEYQAVIDANLATHAPTLVTARGAGASVRFAGVLEQTGYQAWARYDLDSDALSDEAKTARDAGWRIASIDVYGTANAPRYAVTFAPNPGNVGWGFYRASGVSGHQTLYDGMAKTYGRQTLTPFDDASANFGSLWEDTLVGQVISHHDMTSAEYQQKADQYKNQLNYYPLTVCASGSGAGARFAAIWAATDQPKPRLWSVTGTAVPALSAYDTWMQSFMQGGAVRGAALAIVRNGKLVFARGYTNAEAGYGQIQPTSLFRIASCSKPLTSIAVHQDIQARPGVIAYGRKMAGYFNNPLFADIRCNNIDIEHLLTHQGGWDRDKTGGYDPMFIDGTIANTFNLQMPISTANIRLFMQNQPLDFTPGIKGVYSNYGYSLLGRILERINPGMTYAEVVQARIFAPLGISRPRIGGAHVEDRLPGEVLYHPRGLGVARSVNHVDRPWGPSHYGGWNHANMDSHGAWVMAAPDFAKVLAAFDLGFQNPILGQTQTQAMWSLAPGATTTLHGWFKNNTSDGNGGTFEIREHNGILPGTRAYIGRREDGLSFVLFSNGDRSIGGAEGRALSNIANGITAWPQHDLFPAVGIPGLKKIDDLMAPFNPSCPGSAGTPRLVGAGSAQTGGRASLDLSGALPGSPALCLLGATRTSLDLSILGAPCVLSTDPALTLGLVTGRSGDASLVLQVPEEPALVGAHLIAQYAVVDPRANRLGLVTTNGLDVLIGGWLGQ